MESIYLICAIAGGALLVCQLLLAVLGIGGHHDFDLGDHGDLAHDVGFWGLFSFRAIVSGVTIFGLAGLASLRGGMSSTAAPGIAIASAFVVMVLVAITLKFMQRLSDDGSEKIENARGVAGTVYVPIPAANAGLGRVQLDFQNRTVELQAITYNEALETGTKIVVVDIVGPDTVEVIAVPQMRSPNVAATV